MKRLLLPDKSMLTTGKIFPSLLKFSLPMVVINILQMLFNTVDTAILGIMAGDPEVAAVGACGSLISMLICLVSGYSSAANVVISKRVGAQNEDEARRATGTALLLGLLSGVALMLIVLFFSRQFLIATNCQEDVLDMANLYLKIYFLGMPITMLYNFCASILRAAGDSVSPMIHMTVAGAVNVALNVLLVGVFNMTVAGVAIATVLSNAIALALALIVLSKNDDYCKIEAKNLRLRRRELFEMIRIGLPSCLAGMAFYLGEVIVVSAVNDISTDAMTANAISSQLDRLNYIVGSSIASACSVMVAQNFGAKNFDRIRRAVRVGSMFCISVSLAIGIAVVLASSSLLGIFTDSSVVIALAKERLILICLTNFITCNMEIFSNAVRALNRPSFVLVVGLSCGLLIRGLWTLIIGPQASSLSWLFICFPLSTFIGTVIYLFVYYGAMKKERAAALENRLEADA